MFTDGVPVSVFSLAYVVDGQVMVGVVVDPYLDRVYTAIRGEGAYCNGEAIQVNQKHLGDLGYRLNYEMWNHSSFDTMMIARGLLQEVAWQLLLEILVAICFQEKNMETVILPHLP